MKVDRFSPVFLFVGMIATANADVPAGRFVNVRPVPGLQAYTNTNRPC